VIWLPLWTILVANDPAIVNVPPLLNVRQQRQISKARLIAIGSDFLAIRRKRAVDSIFSWPKSIRPSPNRRCRSRCGEPSSVVKIRYRSSRDRAPPRQLKFLGLRVGRSVESSRQSRRSHPQPVSMKAPDLGCRGFVAQLSAHFMRGCRRAPLVLHPTPIDSGSLCKIAHST
jgi:hypothetical protein